MTSNHLKSSPIYCTHKWLHYWNDQWSGLMWKIISAMHIRARMLAPPVKQRFQVYCYEEQWKVEKIGFSWQWYFTFCCDVLYATVEALKQVINVYIKGIICMSHHFFYPDFFLIRMIFFESVAQRGLDNLSSSYCM